MDNKNLQISIQVNAPADEAMKKIAQVSKWWAKNVRGNSEKLHDTFTTDFGETFVDFMITDLVPGKRLVWKVTDCNLHWITDKKEWNGTEVVFELSEKGNGTQIDFTHFGLVPGVECYEDCKTGWNEHVGSSLVQFINEGKGMPV